MHSLQGLVNKAEKAATRDFCSATCSAELISSQMCSAERARKRRVTWPLLSWLPKKSFFFSLFQWGKEKRFWFSSRAKSTAPTREDSDFENGKKRI